MERNQNFLITVVLSVIILALWQVFYINPQVEEQRKLQKIEAQRIQSEKTPSGLDSSRPSKNAEIPLEEDSIPNAHPLIQEKSEKDSSEERILIDTPALSGSIRLSGARIDDLKLKNYRLTVDPHSPMIDLLKPQSLPDGYFAEVGFTSANPQTNTLPGSHTLWKAETENKLTPSSPVVLSFTNSAGLDFKRVISVDNQYMFTLSDTVKNNTSYPITFSTYGRATRLQNIVPSANYLLHEGLIGVTGEEGLQEITYANMMETKQLLPGKSSNGWLGITDKYWAVALVPASGSFFQPRFSYLSEPRARFQADFITDPITLAPGDLKTIQTLVFAGAKEVNAIYNYQKKFNIRQFELLIDWGWFYFITKPMFSLIDILYKFFQNFGLAILGTTVLIKLIFFPLAQKSYKSMAHMKKVQPKLMELREKYSDDKIKQHQAMMELYKKEKINPVAGCWPVLIQIPIFFALYKVLYVTIEMRHAPFFGWIKDLASPDPTSIFNLFGLLHFTPPAFLMIGIWPILMGITMFLQMRMNPSPPDPTQAIIFNWMPVLFTFMLASFPVGLVIYWTWNNLLSVIQQAVIMKYHGTRIELFDPLKKIISKKEKK